MSSQSICYQQHITLTRQQACSKLQQLIPGTEEYDQLQNALFRMEGIVQISLPKTTYKVYTSPAHHRLPGGFGSSEHVAIAKEVIVPEFSKDTPLLTIGITRILFHHIIALAGDFYGIFGEAISLPDGTPGEKQARFLKTFNKLAEAESNEIRKIIQEIESECYAVATSGLPHHCYSSQLIDKNNAIKKIKPDVSELLRDNSDHFSTNAEEAYRIGHNLAIEAARAAGKLKNSIDETAKQKSLEDLKRAYALDAFACHFLSDLFASGHIRNQRGELELFLNEKLGFSKDQAKTLAAILTGAQHEQDGASGLLVYNGLGEQWIAYGDGLFFTSQNEVNRMKVTAAVQQSVNEIHEVYFEPDKESSGLVYKHIPHADVRNPPPLYSIQKGCLFLYRGSTSIEITNPTQYLKEGIAIQAVRHLPPDYIHGFIAPFHIELPDVATNIIIPEMDRFTGKIWHMIGLAAHHQVMQANREISKKIDEMAGRTKATYDNSVQILRAVENIQNMQMQQIWATQFQDIRASLLEIQTQTHQYKTYRDTLSAEQKQASEISLMNAHTRISSIFSGEGIATGRELLAGYRTWLKNTNPTLSDEELKWSVTLWFRQILDYQVNAFELYAFLRSQREINQKMQIQQELLAFQANLEKQIKVNKNEIDEGLIYTSAGYINIQLEKSKVIRAALVKELKGLESTTKKN